ncbi:Hcp family type VI secretion system effector [Saccharospirillum salsuginis]|uniref:Type VI secretion system secreted protein Hcp n=1 Tax=Saccharospirillum salsuginis TaxID=418750 RepID=A0A918K081_9GAMM|nr:Hcp family type VI secretion system effector [Saccharospirillum salsuginis]GGX39288.1 hypothetical protein GCM10007392_02040 [Saccharospirillum salsuginis]
MAIPAYMMLKDDQGNDVQGSVNVAGREGSIEVLAFDHQLRIPTDNDTGELTGTRKHEPFVITKAYDAATPYLYKACSNGQTLQNLVLSWYKIDETGTEVEYFRHTLEGVKITSVKPSMANVKDLDKERYPHLEDVSIRYQKVTWTFLDGNIEFSDSWVEGR